MENTQPKSEQAPRQATQEPQPATPCHDAEQAIGRLGLDRDVASRVVFMDGGVIVEEGSPAELFTHPKHGRTRAFLSRVMEIIDEQVKNADTAGYRRGRNEKIELLTRPLDPVTEAELESDATAPHFPRYTRRSVWDS